MNIRVVTRNIFIRPEIFIYIAIVAFGGLFFILQTLNNIASESSQDIFEYSYRLIDMNRAKIIWTVVPFLIAIFAQGIVLWVKAAVKGLDPNVIFSLHNVTKILPHVRSIGKSVLVVGIPATIAFYGTASALGQLNIFNKLRLKDELFFRLDTFFTGTFPPITAASIPYPDWFIEAVRFSFMNLVWVLVMVGAYIFIINQRLFREAIGAFFLGVMLLYIGWIAFPVLSPHDRFIDNVYELSMPAFVQPYVTDYKPHRGIQSFLTGMREGKEALAVLPTSTFPSAHVAWAVLLVYYAWRLQKWLGFIIFPFALLSSIGTFLFAQHYFVDFPAGILVSAFAIWVAYWLAKKQRQVKVDLQP